MERLGVSRMQKHIKFGVQNLALLSCSILIVYLALELVLCRYFLHVFPLRIQNHLPKGFIMLAQSSKKYTLPQDYIAILGDSYAVGVGDWWLSVVNKWKNSEFASHSILHRRIGRDVISFGQAGVGSLGGLIAKPVNKFRYLNSTLFYKIKEPKIILAYFYESDLYDNLREIDLRFKPRYDIEKIYEEKYFKHFIDEVVIGEDRLYRDIEAFRWHDNLVFLNFIKNIIDRMMVKIVVGEDDQKVLDRYKDLWGVGQVNRVLVNGEEIAVPDILHSPSLDLTEEEINLSLYIFEQSLDYLSKFFRKAKIFVVYIPTPLSSYVLASEKVSIRTLYKKQNPIYNAEDVAPNSDMIAGRIKEITEEKQIVFIDARESVRNAARKELVHGPLDWGHFNKVGYTALAEAIISYIKE